MEEAPHKRGLAKMPRVDAIWGSALFQREYRRLAVLEEDRVFCRHGLPHLLDAARVMWILNLERGCGLDREVVYAAAILHDVGKATQYASGEPHEVAGERMAREILEGLPAACAFAPAEVDAVCAAIRAHRRFDPDAAPLGQLLYQADKASRACFACPAEVRAACSWADEKKNLGISV